MPIIESDQIAKDVHGHTATWEFEVDEGTGILQITLDRITKTATAEWLDWSIIFQEWIGEPVPFDQVRHLVPEKLYS